MAVSPAEPSTAVSHAKWFEAICAVGFDIESGHDLTCLFPDDCRDTEADLHELAFACVPDMAVADLLDSYAGRASPLSPSPLTSPRTTDSSFGEDGVTLPLSLSAGAGCTAEKHQFSCVFRGKQMFGWAIYIQKHDSRRKRNASQQAYCVLSCLPLAEAAHNVLDQLALGHCLMVDAHATPLSDEPAEITSNTRRFWDSFAEWPEPACCRQVHLTLPPPRPEGEGLPRHYTLPCFRQKGYTGGSAAVPSASITLPRRVVVDSSAVAEVPTSCSKAESIRLTRHMLLLKSFCAASVPTSLPSAETGSSRRGAKAGQATATTPRGLTPRCSDGSSLPGSAKGGGSEEPYYLLSHPLESPRESEEMVPQQADDAAAQQQQQTPKQAHQSVPRGPIGRVRLGSSAVRAASAALLCTVPVTSQQAGGGLGEFFSIGTSTSSFEECESPMHCKLLNGGLQIPAFVKTPCRNLVTPGAGADPFTREVSIKKYLAPHGARIRKLWEIMIAGESICVISNSAESASHAVVAMTTLIAPLTYAGQVHPYVTVHNSMCDEIEGCPQKGTVFGCTNPYFLKSLEGFNNCLVLNSKAVNPRDMNKNHRKKRKRFAPYTAEPVEVERNDLYSDRCFVVASPDEPPSDPAACVRSLTQEFLRPLHSYVLSTLHEGVVGFAGSPSGGSIYIGDVWQFFFIASEPEQQQQQQAGSGVSQRRFANYPEPFSLSTLLEHVVSHLAEGMVRSIWKKSESALPLYHDFLHTPTCVAWLGQMFFEGFRNFLTELRARWRLLGLFAPGADDELAVTRLVETVHSADNLCQLRRQVELLESRERSLVIQDPAYLELLGEMAALMQGCDVGETPDSLYATLGLDVTSEGATDSEDCTQTPHETSLSTGRSTPGRDGVVSDPHASLHDNTQPMDHPLSCA